MRDVLILHHLRKDLRRLWPLLVLWLVLVAGSFAGAYAEAADFSGAGRAWRFLEEGRTQLVLGQWLLGLLLPAFLLLEEPLVGTRAFWMTKPLGGATLLASKGLFLVLCVLVPPVAAQMAVLATHGLTPHQLALALAESTLHWSSAVLAVTAVAALAPSLPRFVLLVMAAYIGRFYLYPLVAWLWQGEPRGFWPSGFRSSALAGWLVTCLAAVAVVLHQAWTQRTARTAAIFVAGVLSVAWVDLAWPWRWLARSPDQHLSLEAELRPAETFDCRDEGSAGYGEVALCGRLRLSGLVGVYNYEIAEVWSRLELPDGRVVRHRGAGLGARIWRPGKSVAEVEDVVLVAPEEVYAAYRGIGGDFSAEIDIWVLRGLELARMPLEPGARFERDGVRGRVEGIAIGPARPPTLQVGVTVGWIELLLDPRTWDRDIDVEVRHPRIEDPFGEQSSASGKGRGPGLVLWRPHFWESAPRLQLGFKDRTWYPPGDPRRAYLPVSASEASRWLEEAELVVIEKNLYVGKARVAVEVEGFRMREYRPREP